MSDTDRCIQVGSLEYWGMEMCNRVYSTQGIAPTLRIFGGGNTELKIIEDFFNHRAPREYEEVAPTLRSDRTGLKVEEPLICASRGRNPENPSDRTTGAETQQRLEINESGTSNTLTSVHKDNLVVEPCILKYERNEYGKEIRKGYENGAVNEKIGNMRDLVPKSDGISNTLTSVHKDNLVIEPYKPNYRIRKLTPLETTRLMDFDDEDYYKCKAVGMADSQIYNQDGNSIIVAVLEGIFRKMYIEPSVSNEQLSLF